MLALESTVRISSATKSSWPHLDEKTVMDRIDLLTKHPTLIYQGALGLCGEATFYHHILERALNTGTFFRMAQALFRDGICRLGDLKINPRQRLLDANYPQIVIDRGSTLPTMPPQADWMLLTALRDSENFWSHNYEGEPDQSKAEGSSLGEQRRWYMRSGLYRRRDIGFAETTENSPFMSKDDIFSNVKKTPTNHILMGINMKMIRPCGGDERHAISLESQLTFKNSLGEVIPADDDNIHPSESVNWSVSFDYWTWGDVEPHDPNVVMAFDTFQTHLRGVIVAPYDP